MMWLELLGATASASRCIPVTGATKITALKDLAGGCDLLLHREGKCPRLIVWARVH